MILRKTTRHIRTKLKVPARGGRRFHRSCDWPRWLPRQRGVWFFAGEIDNTRCELDAHRAGTPGGQNQHPNQYPEIEETFAPEALSLIAERIGATAK